MVVGKVIFVSNPTLLNVNLRLWLYLYCSFSILCFVLNTPYLTGPSLTLESIIFGERTFWSLNSGSTSKPRSSQCNVGRGIKIGRTHDYRCLLITCVVSDNASKSILFVCLWSLTFALMGSQSIGDGPIRHQSRTRPRVEAIHGLRLLASGESCLPLCHPLIYPPYPP